MKVHNFLSKNAFINILLYRESQRRVDPVWLVRIKFLDVMQRIFVSEVGSDDGIFPCSLEVTTFPFIISKIVSHLGVTSTLPLSNGKLASSCPSQHLYHFHTRLISHNGHPNHEK